MANKENNFEKDINVPSKEQTNDSLKNSDKNFNENCTHDEEQIIIDDVDVSKCTLYYYGRCNNACNPLNCLFCSDKPNCDFKQLARKTQECENLKAEEKYLKQCCEKAGEELAKHSFNYDGKEKNLVVQAMELNEKYEKFEKALEEIETELSLGFTTTSFYKTLSIINKVKGEGKCQ